MLESLKFVMGAVARKNFQPALTHFRISEGRVLGFNGVIALSAPIDLALDASPKAIQFVKAIERCTETITIHMTDGGRLSLRSGKFKAFVECIDEGGDLLDTIKPEGTTVNVPDTFVRALNQMEPLIGVDASRPWATGILLRGKSAYVTNNIIVAEFWLGEEVPEINIPSLAIRELVRIGEVPLSVQLSEDSVTFHFSGDRWMRSQLLGTDWPDVSPILGVEGEPTAIPEGLFDGIETLKPFIGEVGSLYFREGVISTSNEDGAGASLEITGLPEKGAFHYEQLSLLKGVASEVDFTKHPQPCPWKGDQIRGVILGMVDA